MCRVPRRSTSNGIQQVSVKVALVLDYDYEEYFISSPINVYNYKTEKDMHPQTKRYCVLTMGCLVKYRAKLLMQRNAVPV